MPKDHPQTIKSDIPSSNGTTNPEASRARDVRSSYGRVTDGPSETGIDTNRLSVVADICRLAASDLAKQGYKPDGEKVLRRFGLHEVSRYMIPLPASELRALLKNNQDWPQGRLIGGQPFWTLEELNALRQKLPGSEGSSTQKRSSANENLPAKIVTLCNFKGGVSKTTTAAHLAMAAALDGQSVLVIDLDSQASMSTLFGETAKDETETAYALMAWDHARSQDAEGPAMQDYLNLTADDLIKPTHWPTIDILPAQLNLYWAEFQIPVWLQSSSGWRFWDALQNFLAEQHLLDDYDLVIVDTPPALGYLTINALAAADILLVPVGASFIEFDSTGRFFDMLATTFSSIEETLAESHDNPPKFRWDAVQVLLTRYNDAQQGELGDLIEAYLGDMVSKHRQIDTALVGQAGERVSGIYEAPLLDFNPQTYRRGRETFDESWAVLKQLLAKSRDRDQERT